MNELNLDNFQYYRIVKTIDTKEIAIFCSNENFLDLPAQNLIHTEAEFEKKIETWAFDELLIHQSKAAHLSSVEDLVWASIYHSQPKKTRSLERIQQLNLFKQSLSNEDYLDYFGWGIKEVFLDELDLDISSDLASSSDYCKFLNEDNPMLLTVQNSEVGLAYHYMGY